MHLFVLAWNSRCRRLVHVHSKAAHRTCLDRNCFSMVHMRVTCCFGLLRNRQVYVFIHLSRCTHGAKKVAFSVAVAVRTFSRVCVRSLSLQVSHSRCARCSTHLSAFMGGCCPTRTHVNTSLHRLFYSTYGSAFTHWRIEVSTNIWGRHRVWCGCEC